MRKRQKPVKRLPIDWRVINRETGCTRGTLCHSPAFGWGVQNGNGDAHFCCVTAPEVEPGQTLKVEEGMWAVYA